MLNERNLHATQAPISALLVPCSSRKKVRPKAEAQAVSLPLSDQSCLETAWIERLNLLPTACQADGLYGGRGFQLALRAAQKSGAPLYAISAGLGLVAVQRSVPAYGVTVSGKGPESIATRITGQFDLASWWDVVSNGPYSTPMADVFSGEFATPVVMALSQPYARMLASSLDTLSSSAIARLRIVGSNLAPILPARLSLSVLPYDERLHGILPGTRSDFAQRALFHFVSYGLTENPAGDAVTHRDWVLAALARKKAPVKRQRERLRDQDILALIERHLPRTTGVGRMLRVLRDHEGVACEQARFSRLYRQATNGGGLL
jgi:hypothetical protein